jgi:hypothetical protein
MEFAPQKLFGTFGGVMVTASSGREEAQPKFSASPGLVQIASQGIADQSRNRELLPLGKKAQFTIRGFFEK